MAPALLARSVPVASRVALRAPRAATVHVRWNSSDSAASAAKLSAVAAKARVVKTLPDFSMSNKVRSLLRALRGTRLPSPHQVCLVTGAARGLGNEFCRAFVQSGCTSLAIVDLKEEEAEHAAEELVKAACGQFDVPLTPLYYSPSFSTPK